MKPTKALHDLGQSLWLDNISRDLLNNRILQRYIDEFAVTGLTSNPTIFDHAIKIARPMTPIFPGTHCRRKERRRFSSTWHWRI